MDISKKFLILSMVGIFICIAVAVVCMIVKFNWVTILLSAIIVGLAIYICIVCWKAAKMNKG